MSVDDNSPVPINNSTSVSPDAGVFGLPFEADQSKLILIPVPWEATASYGSGASRGPELIRSESTQIDLLDPFWGKLYRMGIHMLPIEKEILELNDRHKPSAQKVMGLLETHQIEDDIVQEILESVNEGSEQVNNWVYETAQKQIRQNKVAAVIGGDHSCPFGLIQALNEHHTEGFGILHVDAHFDLRHSYQGFSNSHASIMSNVLQKCPSVEKLVSVGIRDFCEEEYQFANECEGVHYLLDMRFQTMKFEGRPVQDILANLIEYLPQKVYLSIDIDGLCGHICPNTGTPVPGGLDYSEFAHLLRMLYQAKKEVIGFDLCEVAKPSHGLNTRWEGILGARMLYQLCLSTLGSQL